MSDISVDFKLSMNGRFKYFLDSLYNIYMNCLDKPSPPRAPAQVSWKTSDTLALQWIASETDGGAKIEEYIVERREVGKKSWKQVGSSSQLSIEIVGLKNDSSYNFRVIARNAVGCSEPFNIEETFTAAKAEIKKSKDKIRIILVFTKFFHRSSWSSFSQCK